MKPSFVLTKFIVLCYAVNTLLNTLTGPSVKCIPSNSPAVSLTSSCSKHLCHLLFPPLSQKSYPWELCFQPSIPLPQLPGLNQDQLLLVSLERTLKFIPTHWHHVVKSPHISAILYVATWIASCWETARNFKKHPQRIQYLLFLLVFCLILRPHHLRKQGLEQSLLEITKKTMWSTDLG